MEGFLKLIKEYKTTKNKKAYLLILIEKSRKIQFPVYSLIQLLNSIRHKPYKIISSEGWIEKGFDLQHQKNIIEKEKAELKKAKSAFEKDKKDNLYFKGSVLVISIIVISIFLFYYVSSNSKLKKEENMWKNALIENTIASYNNFMKQYPKSKYYEKAQEQNRIIKEKLKNNSTSFDSSNISNIKTENKKSLPDYSQSKQEKIESEREIKRSGINYEKAMNYYYAAREKALLKNYNEALNLIDSALIYNNNSNQYIKFKSNIETNLVAQGNRDYYKNVEENIGKIENEKIIKESIVKSNQTPKTEVVETTKKKKLVKKEVFNEIVSFAVVEEAPIYPGCKGSNEEKKKCIKNKIAKHFNKKFRRGFINDLGLSPGKKRIYIQFSIDKTGKIVDAKARGPHKRLENEAIRVAKLLPAMTPGKHHGKIIKVKYTLPITLIVE